MRNFFVFLCLLIELTASAQNRTKPYDFPLKPGMKEWKKFQSRTEMAEALQIPPDILKNLTTEALAKSCLNFPMFKDLYFFNTVQTGFNGLRASFNGFEELLNRNDAGNELFKIYKQMDPGNLNTIWNDTVKGNFSFQFVQIELLLAQDQIMNNAREDFLNMLLKEAAQKYELKKATGQFSGFALSPSMLIVGRILDKQDKLQVLKASAAKDNLQGFLLSGTTDNSMLLDQLLLSSKN